MNPWLHRFAVLTAVITFLLLGLGGLVTSHEAGMSVPDWPTSYGYNMFALPIKFWTAARFSSTRTGCWLPASGFLTTILAVWLWLKDSRKWMKWLGVIAFLLVVAQGVLGGLRVTMKMDSLGIFHGVVAQSFFVLMCAIALFTSRFWIEWSAGGKKFSVSRGLWTLVLAADHPDFRPIDSRRDDAASARGPGDSRFPAAYGKIWPDTSADAVARYNADRLRSLR
jgi:heme a synthase